MRHLTGGHGADVIVDSIGGSNLQKSLQCLAYRGRCLTFGDAGRQTTSRLDISGMRPSNQTLTGYFLGAELLVGRRAHADHRPAARRDRGRRSSGSSSTGGSRSTWPPRRTRTSKAGRRSAGSCLIP